MNMPCSNTALLNQEEIRQVANEVKEAEIDTYALQLEKHYLKDINDFLDRVDQGEVLYKIIELYRDSFDERGCDKLGLGIELRYYLMNLIEEAAQEEAREHFND